MTGSESAERPIRIERPYRVRFEEATPDDTPRSAVYLAFAQDCAWQHSALLGFDRDWYRDRGLFWLVRAIQLDVLLPGVTYETLSVSTEVLGFRRVGARRQSRIVDASGRLLARAEIDWVMTNERGMPTRLPPEFPELFGARLGAFEMHRVAPSEAPDEATERRFTPARRDLDPMDHVNNSVYLDYFEEALEAAGQAELLESTPRRYVLEYVGAAGRGAALIGRVWQAEGGGWLYRLSREDGTELLRACVAA